MTPSDDTDIGPGESRFPGTRHSILEDAASAEPERRERAWEHLVTAYWRPVYKYLRFKWRRSNEDAKDLVQAFFAKAIEKEFFSAFDPAKARFRTFLRVCLDGFVANSHKADMALRRGGGRSLLQLDYEDVNREFAADDPASSDDPEKWFRDEWIRSLLTRCVDLLRQHFDERGQPESFAIFQKYDLERDQQPDLRYEHLAQEFELPVSTITNRLFTARRFFREFVMDEVRRVCTTDQEYREEIRLLFGDSDR